MIRLRYIRQLKNPSKINAKDTAAFRRFSFYCDGHGYIPDHLQQSIWLSSLNMPVTLQVSLSSYLNDLVAMNQMQGVPVPFFALIAASLLIAFLFTRLGLI